jgi:transcriptional regulator with XRE-family HTH domain
MIKNERQYRITKFQANKFRDAINCFSSEDYENTHPILLKAQEDALKSQLEELDLELNEYEALRNGHYKILEILSFDELPQAIIKGRIASGLSQKDLAEKLGLKEQQLQRYESTDFASANLGKVKEIIKAIGLKMKDEIFLPNVDLSLSKILKNIRKLGLDEKFIKEKVFPKEITHSFINDVPDEASISLRAISRISRIFGINSTDFLNLENVSINHSIVNSTRFKKPKNSKAEKISAYVVYAHYLSLLLLETTKHLPPKKISSNPLTVIEDIENKFGEISFENALRYVWSLGIAVLPLGDTGSFHGACWRIEGRNVIVLKQQTKSMARWLFDLLHECYHISQNPEEENFTVVEIEDSKDKYSIDDEEFKASKFAGDVSLKLKSDELVVKCVEEARGSVEKLKYALPKVAKKENVRTDALANYVAFSLMLRNNINWWGAAMNLQDKNENPLQIARQILFENVNLSQLNQIDREILLQALADNEV